MSRSSDPVFGRLGYLSPATIETTLPELYKFSVPGVRIAVSTLRVNEIEPDSLNEQAVHLAKKAEELVQRDVRLLMIAGAPLIFWSGVGSDRQISTDIAAATGIPTIYDPMAVTAALRALGAKRIGIVSPFDDSVNRPMRSFYEGSGFDVASVQGAKYHSNAELRYVPAYVPLKMCHKALAEAPDIDAIYINCAGWATRPAVLEFEREVGIPVVTQMQALAWVGMSVLGISKPVVDRGRLMEIDRKTAAEAAMWPTGS